VASEEVDRNNGKGMPLLPGFAVFGFAPERRKQSGSVANHYLYLNIPVIVISHLPSHGKLICTVTVLGTGDLSL
jgi:hypothetical protein